LTTIAGKMMSATILSRSKFQRPCP
jgi:hypothetical protein